MKTNDSLLLLSTLLLAFGFQTGVRAQGTPITIFNPSFEAVTASAPNGVLSPAGGILGGWTYDRTGVLPATLTDVTFGPSSLATEGSNAANLFFLAGVAAEVSIFQDLGQSYLPSTVYTLTFDASQYSLLSVLTDAEVSLYAGGTQVATLGGSGLLGLLDPGGAPSTVTLEYTTGVSAPLGNIGIEFSAGGLAEVAGSGFVIDNVQLTAAPVPEPGAALLIGAAGMTFMLRRSRFSSRRLS